MAKANNTTQTPILTTFQDFLTAAQLTDDIARKLLDDYESHKDDKRGIAVVTLVMAGLSVKEAIAVHKMRSTKSETISFRVTKDELSMVEDIEQVLRERGYIAEGKGEAILWLAKHFVAPEDKQLKLTA